MSETERECELFVEDRGTEVPGINGATDLPVN